MAKGGKKRPRGSGRKRTGASGGARTGAGRRDDPLSVDALAKAALKAAGELLAIEDPLDAEDWASGLLGTFYKLPVPPDARDELEGRLGPALVRGAEGMRNATGMAVLHALAGVTGDELGARAAAARMAARGVPRPRWAEVIGTPEYLGGWTSRDFFGDQIGYYLTFRYPERPPHMAVLLYDENLGGIIKDAFVAALGEGADPRALVGQDPDVLVQDVDPAEAVARISAAIAMGDQFLDNAWTDDFKRTRALLLARLRLLPAAELPEPPELPDDDAQEALIQEFLASPLAPKGDETLAIVDHAVTARCDYGDGDPLRWSPVVVELFMLDYLPRKVTLSFAEINALPEVLRAWVRFALTRRGLEERFIVETERAVDGFTPEFRKAVTDPENFGPAKAMLNAMRADGVDVMDQSAVDAWLAHFNSLPDEARHSFFGRHIQD